MGDDASYFPGFHFRDLSSGCRIVPMSPGSSLTKRIATKTKEDKAEVIEAASDLVADGVHTGFHWPEPRSFGRVSHFSQTRRPPRPSSAPAKSLRCQSRITRSRPSSSYSAPAAIGRQGGTQEPSFEDSRDTGSILVAAAKAGAAHGFLSPNIVSAHRAKSARGQIGGATMTPPSQSTRYPASGMPTMRAYEAAVFAPVPVNPHMVRKGKAPRPRGCLDLVEEVILARTQHGSHAALQGSRAAILQQRKLVRETRPSLTPHWKRERHR